MGYLDTPYCLQEPLSKPERPQAKQIVTGFLPFEKCV